MDKKVKDGMRREGKSDGKQWKEEVQNFRKKER